MEEECVICFEPLELANVAHLIPCKCLCVCRACADPLRVCPKCQDTLCINVRVKKLQSNVLHTIQVGRDDTVRHLRLLVSDFEGYNHIKIQLVHGGRVMIDNHTLVNVANNSVIFTFRY